MTRVATYARVSTDGQEKDGSSLETQEAACIAYANKHGWEIVQTVRETGSGATLDGRPKLSQLRAMIRAGAVDVVLVYALDRLSRDSDHRGVIRYELGQAGAALDSVTEELSGSIESKLFEMVSGVIAEIERSKIAERTQRGIRARVEGSKDGVQRPIAGKKPPYGFVWADDRKSKLVEEPETAEIVRRIFQEAANGSAMLAIADRLTADGIPTPAGDVKPWHQRTVDVILSQTAYIGEMRSYRHKVETSKKLNKNGKPTRTVTKRPLSETVPIKDAAPALVDRAVYQLAQEQRERRASCATTRRNREEEALLRGGYLRCAHCGGAMVTIPHHGYLIYKCGGKLRKKTDCPPVSVRADLIDGQIWELVARVVNNPKQIRLDAERLPVVDSKQSQRERIERELSQLDKQAGNLTRAIQLLDDDGDTLAGLVSQLQGIGTKRAALRAERDQIASKRPYLKLSGIESLDRWTARLADYQRLRGDTTAYDYAQKRALLAWLGISVTLSETMRRERKLRPAPILGLDQRPYSVSARISLMDAGPWPELEPLSSRQLGVLERCTPTSCWRCRRSRR